ncbi:hypothetical protein GGF31_006945 [Allomyces arbusculus]|nr:hypothetical protein GGF31_006945 [Allomyces arbusculus]
MGGYRLQQIWEPVGARLLGTIAMLIAVGLLAWLMCNVFAPNNRNAKALALGGGGGIPRAKSRKSKCDIASWCAGFGHSLWTGHNARLPMLIFLSVLLVIDTMSCFVHLWIDAYPFVNMFPVYIVRMCTSNWNGGMLTLIVVRRSMVVAASSAKARLGVWLWRVMLLIYLILQPIFTYSTAMAVLDADARNNWLRFGVNPLVVLLSLVYPVVCIVCSLGMGLFAHRLARAMGDFGPGSSTSASGADKSANEVATFRPDMSASPHMGATVAPAAAAPAATSKSSSDNRSRAASSAVVPPSTSGPRASATGTSFVHRTVFTFQILNAAIVLLWVLYLIVQLLGIGSPFTRIILSNMFNGLFLVMEAALKWIMRAGHAIAVRTQQRSVGSSKAASKSAGSQPQSIVGGTHVGLVSTTIGLK